MPLIIRSILLVAAIVASGSAPIKWLPPPQQVAKSQTTRSPALTVVKLPGGKSETVLFWAGPGSASLGYRVSDQLAEDLKHDKWSAPAVVPSGVLTGQSPSAAQFGNAPAGPIILVWEGATDHQIWYLIGSVTKTGALVWSQPAQRIAGAQTAGAPAVFAPLDSTGIVVSWQALKNHQVDYVTGALGPKSVKWSTIGHVPGAKTASGPAIAEVSTGHSHGRLYLFWQSAAAHHLTGAWTADPMLHPAWTTVGSTIVAGTSPAATAIGSASGYPVLIAYREATGDGLRYATLTSAGLLSRQSSWTVPDLHSAVSPALLPGILAATDPGAVDYLPFVRVCAGC